MGKKQVYIIAGVTVLIILLFIGILFEIRDIPDYSYITKYDLEEKDPADAYAFTQLLKKRFGDDAVVQKDDSIKIDSLATRHLYVSIGPSIRYNNRDQENLLKFIEAGNDAILISSQVNFIIPLKLSPGDTNQYEHDKNLLKGFEDVFDGEDEYYYEDYDNSDEGPHEEFVREEIEQDAYQNEHQEEYEYENNQEENTYYQDSTNQIGSTDSIIKDVNIQRYITPYHRDTILEFDFIPFDSAASKYSYIQYGRELNEAVRNDFHHFTPYSNLIREPLIFTKNEQHIYCKIKVGNGNLFVHTIPELFTNIATQQSFYLEHYNRVFSPFDVDKVIIDEPDPFSYLIEKQNKKSPLQYILSIPSLSWAYYLLVATLVLFVIFRGKRTQRFIPTVQKNTNTSMDYIKTLSILHQNQAQNSKLIKHIREGFFHRIKTKYFLDHKDEFFIEKLAAKSKIELQEIENLLHKLHSTGGAEFSDDQLITLYRQIESFYKKAA